MKIRSVTAVRLSKTKHLALKPSVLSSSTSSTEFSKGCHTATATALQTITYKNSNHRAPKLVKWVQIENNVSQKVRTKKRE